MLSECQVWIHEVREFFPALNKYIILASYGEVPKKSLSILKSKIIRNANIRPKELEKGKRIKKLRREYKVTMNKELKKIKDIALRRQVIFYTAVSELIRIETKDLLKSYNKTKKKKVRSILLEEGSLERYNFLRKRNNLPEIRDIHYINLAINQILTDINIR